MPNDSHCRCLPRRRPSDLALPEGAIGCLLGPSGCGKTTALRCISGFEPIQSGEIRIGGEVVSRPGWMLPAEKRRVGMVFQDYALFPHLAWRATSASACVASGREKTGAHRRTAALVGLAAMPTSILTNSPAASSSASRSPARWRRGRA